MSEATAILIGTPAKTPIKRSKPKKTGPTVSDRILQVVSASKDRSGVSLPALKKSLFANGYDVLKNKARINLAVRRLVSKGDLLQTKGTGASGSFKINKNKSVAKKKKAIKKKAKKVVPKKVKRSSPKKKATSNKSPKKTKKRKAKSPKNTNTPAAVKKAKSPRKTQRRVSRSTRTKATPKK